MPFKIQRVRGNVDVLLMETCMTHHIPSLQSMCRPNRGTVEGYYLAGRYMSWLPVSNRRTLYSVYNPW